MLKPGRYKCLKHMNHRGSEYFTSYIPMKSAGCNGVAMEFDRELNTAELREIADDEKQVLRDEARMKAEGLDD